MTSVNESASPPDTIRVLLAEDEAHLGMILEQFLASRGFMVRVVRNGRDALDQLRAEPFDVALLDINMPEVNGLDVLRQLREEPLPPEIIVITGNSTTDTALTAMKLGAYDFLSKPYRMAEIEPLIRRAWEKRVLTHENSVLRAQVQGNPAGPPVFVTQYAPLRAVLSLAERAAVGNSSVLLEGEPGTGRETLARVMHAASARREQPFIALDCRVADETTLVTQLFRAWRGTLFLRDVDALHPSLQQILVDATQTGFARRSDSTLPFRTDARLMASQTPGVDINRSVLGSLFRAVHVLLPPLRERAVDIAPLARTFVDNSGGEKQLRIDDGAIDLLAAYTWPGNVGELRDVIEQAKLLARGAVIDARIIQHVLTAAVTELPTVAAEARIEPTTTMEELERRHIATVLEQAGWHQGRAAAMLGISPKTLYRKIREYGFQRPSHGRT